jgi:hypothetical protein
MFAVDRMRVNRLDAKVLCSNLRSNQSLSTPEMTPHALKSTPHLINGGTTERLYQIVGRACQWRSALKIRPFKRLQRLEDTSLYDTLLDT